MDNEELRKTLIDVEKQWISYKDTEFKTLESSFYLKNEKNPAEVAKKLSEKYKIKVTLTLLILNPLLLNPGSGLSF